MSEAATDIKPQLTFVNKLCQHPSKKLRQYGFPIWLENFLLFCEKHAKKNQQHSWKNVDFAAFTIICLICHSWCLLYTLLLIQWLNCIDFQCKVPKDTSDYSRCTLGNRHVAKHASGRLSSSDMLNMYSSIIQMKNILRQSGTFPFNNSGL